VGKFETYQVDLKNMAPAEIRTYNYLLDSKFFADIDSPEVRRGRVNVSLTIECKNSSFEMKFHTAGTVYIPCDRCLDDMEVLVEAKNRLIVKFGKEYAEESDEILVISQDENSLNLAWFLYEFVTLAIPMKHIHSPGRCNKSMAAKLKKHSIKRSKGEKQEDTAIGYEDIDLFPSEEEGIIDSEEPLTDPRWDALKDLM
jgi:uncharacterized metal-binding protein YceD (DUF177 family)